jgi:4-hydroxythreonine-4-phosphate dehydrogenase
MSYDMLTPLALTLGEAAGVGPDIALAAWVARDRLALPPFYVVGDPATLERRAHELGVTVPVRETRPASAISCFATSLPVVHCGVATSGEPGRPDESSAAAAIASIRHAVADVLAGKASAIVTNPIAKAALYRTGFEHPGHTEFLAALATETGKPSPMPVMMLWSRDLAVVPVTIHVSLRDAIAQLSSDLIERTARIVNDDLRTRFGLSRPRLAFCGLNPHAGEGGALGKEEETVIAPALARLKADGIDASGPFPADSLFHEGARRTYDCAICMYHDQALIPIKTIAFHDAVNVTLGLPFVRTSPDHGTAFDIAGTGQADPASLIAALRLAQRLAEARAPRP